MSPVSENERKLLESIRKHKKKEKEIVERLNDPTVKYLNEATLLSQIKANHTLGETIRELLDEIKPPTFRDSSDLEHLKRIRNQNSETDKLYLRSIFYDLSNDSIRPVKDILIKLEKIEDEKRQQLASTLDEMITYFGELAGDSVTFFERRKKFGTILVERPLPDNIEPYLGYIKNCYLLHMNEAVIGLCRVLIEVACQKIYDKLPESKKLKTQDINVKIRKPVMISKACHHRLKYLGKNTKEIENTTQKAVDLYDEASKILHGKLLNSKTDDETLEFVRDVFSFIESLYRNVNPKLTHRC